MTTKHQAAFGTDLDLAHLAPEVLLPHYGLIHEMKEKGAKVLVRGEGARLWDSEGKEYIDAHSILWVTNIGHGRKEVADACAEQMQRLAYGSLFGGYANEPAIRLAEKLKEIAPFDLHSTFLVSGGSEAVESAIKIARQYHQRNKQPGRTKIISRRESYHGVTYGALSATGMRIYRQPFEPLVPGFHHVNPPYPYRCTHCAKQGACTLACADEINAAIEWEGPKTVAAVIAEPVMSAAGAIPPPPGYLERLREICDTHGVLLIMDEVVNAWGRVGGELFACKKFNVRPDMITLAKAMSGGYAPIGGVMVSKTIADAFENWMLVHGLTYGGHPVACTAALKNIEILQREKLPERAEVMGVYLMNRLQTLNRHRIVGEIRGIGLHTAIEYVKDKKTRERIPSTQRVASQVEELAWQRGIYMCRASVDKTYVAPPLVVTEAQIDAIVDALDESIGIVEKTI